MLIKSFRDLRIWNEAHALTVEVYSKTRTFPHDEKFGLALQMRRSASSVMANIAEGMGRRRTKEFINFLIIARGSVQETISHCILTRSLAYFDEATSAILINRYTGLSAGIEKYIASLNKKIE